jgi:DNA polymerase-3 subunit gamma/tau
MSYVVLARKYRPQAFADMTGQEHVVRTLANAIAQDRVAHAYLFCGPRGVGKTTAARLLAKALNCQKGPTATPCGVCAPCTEIAAGTNVDVAEIDGASNNGVDNVREIRENVKYLPSRDRNKIYIIDEVHMLTGAAFNALLKTLEEPPPHVKFIFATTEPHKLPDTILSRCQRHNFRRIPTAMMIARLREILTLEKATLTDRSLAMVARQSEGGMRDSLSLLDQILSACGLAPTDEMVAEALGSVDRTQVHRLAKALLGRDAKDALAAVDEVFIRGVELKRLAEELSLYLRHVLVAKVTGEAPDELAESERKAALELAAMAEAVQISRLFDIAHQSIWDVGRAAQPKLALEVALLKGIHLAPGAGVEALVEKLEAMQGKLATGVTSAGTGASSAPVRPGPTFPVATGGAAPAVVSRPAATAPQARPSLTSVPRAELAPSPAPVLAPVAPPVVVQAPATVSDIKPRPAPEPEPESEPEGEAEPEAMHALETDTSPGGCATGECVPSLETEKVVVPESAPLAPTLRTGRDVPTAARMERWKRVLETIKGLNPRLADSLSHGRLIRITTSEIAVAFVGPNAGFHKMQSESPNRRNELEKGLHDHFGRPMKCVVEAEAPADEAQTLSPAEETALRRSTREQRLKKAATDHPNVKAALALLGGRLQDVRVRDEIARPAAVEDSSAPDEG